MRETGDQIKQRLLFGNHVSQNFKSLAAKKKLLHLKSLNYHILTWYYNTRYKDNIQIQDSN